MNSFPPEGYVITKYPTCPECGQVIESVNFEAKNIVELPEMEAMWPGGPVISVPGTIAGWRHIPGPEDWQAVPCGHFVPRAVLKWETRPAQ